MTRNLFASFTWRMIAIALTLTIGLGSAASAQEKAKCIAIAKSSGKQCKITASAGPYCHIHIHDKNSPDKPRCGVKTAKGTPCKHIVKRDGLACKQHSN